jgi:hypothetical protein
MGVDHKSSTSIQTIMIGTIILRPRPPPSLESDKTILPNQSIQSILKNDDFLPVYNLADQHYSRSVFVADDYYEECVNLLAGRWREWHFIQET